MAFTIPIVRLYQELEEVTVAPGTPDLNTCIIAPAYYIQDYNSDKSDISAGEFVKTGYTEDAACSATGASAGRPDPNADFLTLSDPPNHISGGELDSDSVVVYMDDALVELTQGTSLAYTDGSNVFTGGANFITNGVQPGDRLVLTKDSVAANTFVKTVKEVVSETELKTTGIKLATEDMGASGSVWWRVEHRLQDQEVDSAHFTVSGQEIVVSTGPTGLLISYDGSTWPCNYGQLYVGYRELRTDLDSVTEIDGESTTISSTIGRVDSRNPLAAMAQVSLANTNTPIQVFGITEDSLAGQQGARDKISSRDDIYCIVPGTDSISGSSWVSIISMWKSHCVDFADPDTSKLRIVIGSYDTLPESRAAVSAQTDGYTKVYDDTVDYDVFVDGAVATQFVTEGVDSDTLLDIGHNVTVNTLGAGEHIFTSGYGGAIELLGAIGEKRLRTTSGSEFGSDNGPETCAYTARRPLLVSEGGSAVATDTACSITASAGDVKVTAGTSGGFSAVAVDDVVHIRGSASYDGGWLVTSKPDNDNIVLSLAHTGDEPVPNVEIYRPTGAEAGITTATGPDKITSTTGIFANVFEGDIVYILQDTGTPANTGMWIVTSVVDSDNVYVSGGGDSLGPGATADVAVFGAIARESNGSADIYTRQRLNMLRDDNASFITSVSTGDDIEIPYPADTDPTKWDTTTTKWEIDTIVDDNRLIANLGELEELAPEEFIAGFNGDCPYRVSVELNKASQVDELNTITAGVSNSRCVMTWPNEVLVTGVTNNVSGSQPRLSGQYLAAAVGGMVAGLPAHQGFTYIAVAGIDRIYNSNNYFTQSQLEDLRDHGWYVFVQDSASSLPYTIHEVTTDVSAYDYGELMAVKNFDYVSLYLQTIANKFKARYNITPETLITLKRSLQAGIDYLMDREFPKIGAPVIDGTISAVQTTSEKDRVSISGSLDLPAVMNQIDLHLTA